jgi:hypothetical protein
MRFVRMWLCCCGVHAASLLCWGAAWVLGATPLPRSRVGNVLWTELPWWLVVEKRVTSTSCCKKRRSTNGVYVKQLRRRQPEAVAVDARCDARVLQLCEDGVGGPRRPGPRRRVGRVHRRVERRAPSGAASGGHGGAARRPAGFARAFQRQWGGTRWPKRFKPSSASGGGFGGTAQSF